MKERENQSKVALSNTAFGGPHDDDHDDGIVNVSARSGSGDTLSDYGKFVNWQIASVSHARASRVGRWAR